MNKTKMKDTLLNVATYASYRAKKAVNANDYQEAHTWFTLAARCCDEVRKILNPPVIAEAGSNGS